MEILNVLAAAFVGFLYGAVHYTVLSKPWLKVSGVVVDENGKPTGSGSMVPFLMNFIAMILVAGMMRHVLAMAGIEAIPKAAMAGFGIGAFFITPWILMNNAFPGRPYMLTVIDGAYAIIGCTLIGAVLAAF